MKSKKKQLPGLNRRTFLNLAGLTAMSSLSTGSLLAKSLSSGSITVLTEENNFPTCVTPLENKIAIILETKIIGSEPGKYLGSGTEYGVDTRMHPVIEKRVVESDRYMGWPTITKTSSGELIAAVSGDRDAHVCPWGKTQIVRSSDEGKTWSKPFVITNTPLDDRDAGIIQSAKGTLIVSWFTSVAYTLPVYRTAYERYARIAEKVTPEIRKQWLGNWVRRSEDGGNTWLEPVRTVVTGPHGPIQLKDSRLLYIGNGTWQGRSGLFIEESVDDGRSWQILSTIPRPKNITPETSLVEPHMVQLTSGKIIAMVRHEPRNRQCYLLQSESTDGGKTWSELSQTGIWGYPPHLIQLKNGWLLVVYGYRREPFSERACISRDEGKTWDIDNEITLAIALGPDIGYPSSVQLSDESILTVFYQAAKPGGPTILHSTHWRLK